MLVTEVDQRPDLYEVQDQGRFPTCLSYATSIVHKNNKDLDSVLSAEVLHYNASKDGFNTGCTMKEIQKTLLQTGQPREQHCEDLTEENSSRWSPPIDVDYYTSVSEVADPSTDRVRELIRKGKLPVLGISITNDFHYPEPPWVFSAGNVVGRHAVVGVGLGESDGETIVLIRNSWGGDWANSGHAWLDSSYLDQHLEKLLLVNRGDNQ